MTLYTVHDRPVAAGQEPDFTLVKEGFNWWAFLIPLIWLLARQQWLGLLVYLAAAAAIGVAFQMTGLDPLTQGLMWLVFALFVGAIANDWRRWRLDDRGYRLAGVVDGHGLDDAETCWLHRLSTAVPAEPPPAMPKMSEPAARPPRHRLQPFASPFDPD